MARHERKHIGQQGQQKERAPHLLRHTFGKDGKIRGGHLGAARPRDRGGLGGIGG